VLQITSLDPLALAATDRGGSETLIVRQLFEGLVGYDPRTLRPRPALASSWRVSDDARAFTFELRRARFHNGREVTADDVVFSLSRLARASCAPGSSPIAGAPSSLLQAVVGYADAAVRCSSESLSGVVALGPHRVQISLTEPWADLPSALGNTAASIVPRDAVSLNESLFGSRPVGTGPWRLAKPWDGRGLRLERNGAYWGARARLAGLAVLGYSDEMAAYLDLLERRLDYAPIPASRTSQARARFGRDGFVTGTGLYFFGINLRSPRMATVAFRSGLSRSVDRASLASAVFDGTRERATAVLPPSLRPRDTDCGPCAFDLAQARAQVQKAWPQGPPEIVVSASNQGPNPQAAEALARMFAGAGVTARVIVRSFRDHLAGLQAGDSDVFQLGWIPDYPSADGVFWPLLRSTAQDNYMRYSRREVDDLLEQARRTVNESSRTKLFARAERIVVADMPVIPLLWYRTSVAVDRHVKPLGGAVLIDGTGNTNFATLTWS
jgi:peptide/nickel transport system substrate-binding protein/oligopeptide transport system substrate-binding protein